MCAVKGGQLAYVAGGSRRRDSTWAARSRRCYTDAGPADEVGVGSRRDAAQDGHVPDDGRRQADDDAADDDDTADDGRRVCRQKLPAHSTAGELVTPHPQQLQPSAWASAAGGGSYRRSSLAVRGEQERWRRHSPTRGRWCGHSPSRSRRRWRRHLPRQAQMPSDAPAEAIRAANRSKANVGRSSVSKSQLGPPEALLSLPLKQSDVASARVRQRTNDEGRDYLQCRSVGDALLTVTNKKNLNTVGEVQTRLHLGGADMSAPRAPGDSGTGGADMCAPPAAFGPSCADAAVTVEGLMTVFVRRLACHRRTFPISGSHRSWPGCPP